MRPFVTQSCSFDAEPAAEVFFAAIARYSRKESAAMVFLRVMARSAQHTLKALICPDSSPAAATLLRIRRPRSRND